MKLILSGTRWMELDHLKAYFYFGYWSVFLECFKWSGWIVYHWWLPDAASLWASSCRRRPGRGCGSSRADRDRLRCRCPRAPRRRRSTLRGRRPTRWWTSRTPLPKRPTSRRTGPSPTRGCWTQCLTDTGCPDCTTDETKRQAKKNKQTKQTKWLLLNGVDCRGSFVLPFDNVSISRTYARFLTRYLELYGVPSD